MIVTLELLDAVNNEVNKEPYANELRDDWTPIDSKKNFQGDDCDSYATAKLQKLHELGVPLSEMRLATCQVEVRKLVWIDHAVLLVEVDGKTVVLGNPIPGQPDSLKVTPYDLLPYKWIKLQIAGTPNFEFV